MWNFVIHTVEDVSEDFEGLLVSAPIPCMNPFCIITEMVIQSSFHTSRDREIITSQDTQEPVSHVSLPYTRHGNEQNRHLPCLHGAYNSTVIFG